MKKTLSIVVIIFIFVIIIIIFLPRLQFKMSPTESLNQVASPEPISGLVGQILIKGGVWNIEISDSESNQIRGLSGRKTLSSKEGMLFVFNEMTAHPFWMKDMLFPIDMIFFDENWKIVLIESNLQPDTFPKIFGSSVKSQYVLEVNALESKTFGLQVGDQAFFSKISS